MIWHTVDYHPSPSKFTSSVHPLIFLWTPKRFISPEYFLHFFSNVYIAPKFHIHAVNKVTKKYNCESKNLICLFLLMSPSKTLPRFLSLSLQAGGNNPFPPNNAFQQKIGKDYEAEKNDRN